MMMSCSLSSSLKPQISSASCFLLQHPHLDQSEPESDLHHLTASSAATNHTTASVCVCARARVQDDPQHNQLTHINSKLCIMGRNQALTPVCVRPPGSEPGFPSQRPGLGSGPHSPDLQRTNTHILHFQTQVYFFVCMCVCL